MRSSHRHVCRASCAFSSPLAAQQSVTPSSAHFYGGGGTYQWLSIVAPANVTWTATTSNYNWLSFNWGYSHVNGTGPGTINLDAQQNSSGASRSATVTVTPSSGLPMTVAITQDVLIANTTPTVTVVNPLSSNVPGPASQMVSVTFDDPNGPGYLPSVQFGFGFVYGYDPSCSVMYNTQYDTLYFDSPANGWQQVTLGQSGLMNSTWCQLNPATSSVVFSGTSVT